MQQRYKSAILAWNAAVSVKMSALLFGPGLLTVLVLDLGIKKSFLLLAGISAIFQLLLGAPFLLTNPRAYIAGSFDLSRVFEHRWTVNWKFLDPEVFVDRRLAISLLALHIFLLAVLLVWNC